MGAACEDFARTLPYALLFGGCPSNLARVDWRTSIDLDVSQQTSGGAFNAPCRLMGSNPMVVTFPRIVDYSLV